MSYEIIKMTTPLGQVPPKSIFRNLQDKHYYIKTAEKNHISMYLYHSRREITSLPAVFQKFCFRA